MNDLVKPHISQRAHRIARKAADGILGAEGIRIYRRTYIAAEDECDAFPIWETIAIGVVCGLGGYLLRCLQ